MKIQIFLVMCVIAVLCSVNAMSIGLDVNDSCYQNIPGVIVYFDNISATGVYADFGIQNTCVGGTSVQWVDPVNASVLGEVVAGEVVIADNFVYVDSTARPDLDQPAILRFKRLPFVMEPMVMRNGVECGDCNKTYIQSTNELVVVVPGFSNYSLSGRKDFVVYSDQQPELASKVYQTIDLGDANRDTEFSCIVQIFGLNPVGQYVLLQTNPLREVQAKVLGNPDQNQPESLGYFPTKAGIANVYFRGDIQPMAGYEDFEYVAQCSSNATKLVYEEPISTRYPQLGRSLTGRGIWLSQDSNAFFLVIMFVVVFFGSLIAVKTLKMILR